MSQEENTQDMAIMVRDTRKSKVTKKTKETKNTKTKNIKVKSVDTKKRRRIDRYNKVLCLSRKQLYDNGLERKFTINGIMKFENVMDLKFKKIAECAENYSKKILKKENVDSNSFKLAMELIEII